jgi:hypothetical protein
MARIHNDEMTLTKDLKSEGTLAQTGAVTGAGYRDITMFYNNGVIVSDWTNSTNGVYLLAHNITGKSVNFPLTALKEGDIIQKFRVLGGVEAISGSATTLDACLWKVTKAAAADATATSLGAITQVSAVADAAVDSEKDVTDVTVADDYQYFVDAKATTANTDECGAMVIGVEVDIKRLI